MKTFRLTLCLLLICLSPLTLANFTIDGESLHVDTDNYKVRLDKGVITHLHNKLTNDTYTLDSNRTPDFRVETRTIRRGISTYNANRIEIHKANLDYVEMLFRKDENQIRLLVGIDSDTGDLLISADGISEWLGVIGIQWGIENLDLHNLRLIIPAETRQIVDATSDLKNANFRYPSNHWEAQLAIIEAERGGFYVRGTDPTFQFKRLQYKSDANSFGLEFETHNHAPWDTLTSAESITWRLNTYDGDWCVPAQIHRDWMEEAFDPWRLSDVPAWVSDISLVAVHQKLDKGVIARLAEFADPTKTLLYLTNWRKEGHGVNTPDYSNPHERFEEILQTAYQHGFRVMLHANIHDCSANHPLYQQLKRYHIINASSGELSGWKWDEIDHPQRNAHISLASSQWRNLLVQEFTAVWERYNIDALFLDTTHYVPNDANGLIEGLSSAQGNVLLHKQLAEAMPGVVFSGEHLHEVTFFRESFARKGLTAAPLHPISAFLFSPYTRLHGGIGTPNTINLPEQYQLYLETAESQGYIPTLWVPRENTFDDPLALQIFDIARRRQALGLSPDVRCDWGPNTLFQYTTHTGETVRHNGSVLVIDNPDLNRDGKVNVLDMIIISNQLGQQVPPATPGDLNGDGVINILDLTLLLQSFE